MIQGYLKTENEYLLIILPSFVVWFLKKSGRMFRIAYRDLPKFVNEPMDLK